MEQVVFILNDGGLNFKVLYKMINCCVRIKIRNTDRADFFAFYAPLQCAVYFIVIGPMVMEQH